MKNRLAVLVDRSASMNFPVEPGGVTRSAQAAAFLEKAAPELAALQDRYTVEVYGFDPELSPTSAEALREGAGAGGHVGPAVGAALGGGGGAGGARSWPACCCSATARTTWSWREARWAGRARRWRTWTCRCPPSWWASEALKDLAVERVKVDDFAFVRNSHHRGGGGARPGLLGAGRAGGAQAGRQGGGEQVGALRVLGRREAGGLHLHAGPDGPLRLHGDHARLPGRGGGGQQHPLLRAEGDSRPRARAAGGGAALVGRALPARAAAPGRQRGPGVLLHPADDVG